LLVNFRNNCDGSLFVVISS